MLVENINNLAVNGIPLLINANHISNFLNGRSKKSIVMHSFKMSSLMTHYYNAYDYRKDLDKNIEVHNVFKLINIYGYGVCKQFTVMMSYMLDIFNIRYNILYLGKNTVDTIDHFAIEVFYDKKWHYFDPNLNLCFSLNNEIVSISDIHKRNFDSVIGDFSAKVWIDCNKNLKHLSDTKKFQELYLNMFDNIEIFTLKDNRFEYKNKFLSSQALSKWHTYNEKIYFIQNNVKIDIEYNGYGVSNYEKIPSKNNISFKNIIFNFNNFNFNKVIINDFPFILLDCVLITKANSVNLEISIHGKSFNIKYNCGDSLFDYLYSKEDIYIHPIYSMQIDSDSEINEYKLTTQSSIFVDKIFHYMEKNKNHKQNKILYKEIPS